MERDVEADGGVAIARSLARGIGALRLNQHFPSAERLRALLPYLPDAGRLRLDARNGLPVGSEWARLAAEHAEAPASLAAWADLPDSEPLVGARRHELAELCAIAGPPIREIHVALRHLDGQRASFIVRVDRIDLATGTIARYTLTIGDVVGRMVEQRALELRASDAFRARLELLSSQDAGLAFAALREGDGLDVEEVVRGVLGPVVIPGMAGPDALTELPVREIIVSACLERASVDVRGDAVDDPLASTVVLAAPNEGFGVSRQRKWAASRPDVAPLKAWLADRRSRNLVYGY